MKLKNILMVCLGNICRSPVAEGIMRSKLKALDLNMMVDSAGTSNYHIGEAPDSRSVKNAAKNGIDISQLKARQFQVDDFDRFDIIYAMDEQNRIDILSKARNDGDKIKVKLMMQALENESQINVPDPYFGTEVDFQLVFDLLNKSCETSAISLSKKLNTLKQ